MPAPTPPRPEKLAASVTQPLVGGTIESAAAISDDFGGRPWPGFIVAFADGRRLVVTVSCDPVQAVVEDVGRH